MDWKKLLETQAGLDIHIMKENGVRKEDVKNEKILALLVEAAELANETRCFKYWSKKLASIKTVILEEYVDCLHFILSIGNDMYINIKPERLHYRYEDTITNQFNRLFLEITEFYISRTKINYFRILNIFLALGEKLGFTEQEIEEAYIEKNNKNHIRQLEGY